MGEGTSQQISYTAYQRINHCRVTTKKGCKRFREMFFRAAFKKMWGYRQKNVLLYLKYNFLNRNNKEEGYFLFPKQVQHVQMAIKHPDISDNPR